MPRGDCTGPMGTGRGAGWCSGYNQFGFANRGPGFAARLRLRGYGRGCRNWDNATGAPGWARGRLVPEAKQEPDNDLADLRAEASLLAEQLESMRRRIEALGGATPQP